MMLFFADVIEYLAILASTLYTFKKLTGNRFKWIDLIFIPLLIAFAVALHYIDFYAKMLVPISILVFYSVVFKIRHLKMPLGDVINMSAISVGISIFFTLIAFILSLPFLLLIFMIENEDLRNLIAKIPLSIFLLTMTFILFKIKRFKSAITPLKKDGTYDALTFASIISIFAMTLYYVSRNEIIGLMEISFLFLAFSALTLIIGWRRVIKRRYRQEILHRNMELLDRELETCRKEQQSLAAKNEELAKIIHRDNKLIPSMMLALEDCLKDYNPMRADELFKEIKQLYDERTQAIEDFTAGSNPLKKSGDLMLDSIMQFLYGIALKRNVAFDFDCEENAVQLLREKFSAGNELNTLLCDLGENAIIAAQGGGKVKVLLDCPDNMPRICVFDNGVPFDIQVLTQMGKKKITTHINDGGSGIGLYNTFGLLTNHAASFIIDEAIISENYTKCIYVIPDGKNRRCIHTVRESVKRICGEKQVFNELI